MITIINYGLGNVRAFVNVYERLNIPVSVANTATDLKSASKIIFPGVSTFDYAMQLLQKSGMRETLNKLVLQNKIPVLGICVGMQMMAHSSEEGNLQGLGWIDGIVKKINISETSTKIRLPHMGWNNVEIIRNSKLLQNIDNKSRFYFLHSYYFHCHNKKDIIALTDYGHPFPCAINSENIYGVQFHPEKSHKNGIEVLKNFANL